MIRKIQSVILFVTFSVSSIYCQATEWRRMSLSEIFGRDVGIPISVEIPLGLVSRGFVESNPAFVILVPSGDLEKSRANLEYRPPTSYMSAKMRPPLSLESRGLEILTEAKLKRDYESGGAKLLSYSSQATRGFEIVSYSTRLAGNLLSSIYFTHQSCPIVFNLALVSLGADERTSSEAIARIVASLRYEPSEAQRAP